MANAGLSRGNSALAYREESPERRARASRRPVGQGRQQPPKRGGAGARSGSVPKAAAPKKGLKSVPAPKRTAKSAAAGKTRTKGASAVRKAPKESAKPPKREAYVRPWEKVAAKPSSGAVSEQTRRNQERAIQTNIWMVLLLVIAMGALMFIIVQFLQTKAEYTATLSQMADLESELSSLQEDNDAYYNSLNTNVDLSGLKKRALTQLGMNNPTQDQVQSYDSPEGSGFMRQYQDAPE